MLASADTSPILRQSSQQIQIGISKMPERLATIAENMLQVPLPSTKQPKIQQKSLKII